MAGVVKQQTITWANVDPGSCGTRASSGHNKVIAWLPIPWLSHQDIIIHDVDCAKIVLKTIQQMNGEMLEVWDILRLEMMMDVFSLHF